MCFQSFVRLLLEDFKLFFSDFVGFFSLVIVTILTDSSGTKCKMLFSLVLNMRIHLVTESTVKMLFLISPSIFFNNAHSYE